MTIELRVREPFINLRLLGQEAFVAAFGDAFTLLGVILLATITLVWLGRCRSA